VALEIGTIPAIVVTRHADELLTASGENPDLGIKGGLGTAGINDQLVSGTDNLVPQAG
jgi:hypothetical protein